MPTYTPSQRSSIAQFVSFTQAKESIAARFLKSHDWNVERALDSFYQSGSGNSVPPVQHNLNKLFDQYRDNPKESPDTIGIEGAQKYLTDLGIELDEVAHLSICDLLQCPSIGEFERESFVSGWRNVSLGDKAYDTTARQAQYVEAIRKKLANNPAYFKQVYRNAFKLAKPEGQRSVPMDSAIDFWNMFFRQGKGGIEWNSPSTQWLDLWCEFYESQSKRPVNKDLWNMVGELVMKTKEPGGESLSWWTEDGAWPMAIDDFVNFIKEKRKGSGDSMDTS
ncbi:hypothetical protein, variant 2 [Cladophialophora immunda]|uniref:Defective in cullin neddylation protein n=1 Tax=Cladophialophora immunda TaxID=569365 RepID=A0A0D2B7B8_9EURO|nr:hypothetical protein, variant 2 [Cladophialophora immunda]KIW33472.1 hypothetical protein, variant 2 [Cladophialophora immunda]